MISRRAFLAETAAGAALGVAAGEPRKKIAALSTTYHVRSHSDNFITRFLEGYWINETYYPPPCDVVSLYTDQVHSNDISRRLSAAYGFKIYPTIAEALTLGAGKLAVDAVLLIGEHGDYPSNEKLQKLYPRYDFFKQVVEVYDKSGRAAPLFTDKHLSYDWTKAKWMYDQSKRLKFPMMAGSSVSVTFRRPELDFPLDAPFEEALAVGSGWIEDGGIFHNLEMLQCFVERRKGGETGVRAVEHLEGEAVWKTTGRWPRELLDAALARSQKGVRGRPEDVKNVVLCRVEYNDGFTAHALMLPGMVNENLFAA
ncbi:MAG: twin-arginine translocation signal domain-containing protein, partial [Acidobacteria bacterium]|nr:twin-arginine translocation signal domain-containing protein [Acidobacteriota bacterium]